MSPCLPCFAQPCSPENYDVNQKPGERWITMRKLVFFSFILYDETSKIIGFGQVLPGHLNNGTGCVTERR